MFFPIRRLQAGNTFSLLAATSAVGALQLCTHDDVCVCVCVCELDGSGADDSRRLVVAVAVAAHVLKADDKAGYPALGGRLMLVGLAVHQKAIVHVGRDDLHHVVLVHAYLVLGDGRVGDDDASTARNSRVRG